MTSRLRPEASVASGSVDQLREAILPDVDGIHDECVRSGIELISSYEGMERADRDPFDGQAATTALFWQRLPDAVAGDKGERRCQIVAPEQCCLVSIELGSNVLVDRRADANRSTHLPRACKRRRSRSSRGRRLIVSDDSSESADDLQPIGLAFDVLDARTRGKGIAQSIVGLGRGWLRHVRHRS